MGEETFGQWLKRNRLKNGLSQPEVAERVSISKSYFVKLERDFKYPKTNKLIKPSLELVEALAVFLKASIEEARQVAGCRD